MFFSVVIPTYNRLELLFKVIAALKEQKNAPEFEIIVVDDGSEETTQQAISRISGIHTLFQKNAGPATARNRGVAAAKGDYLVFIGDDTVPNDDFLFQHATFHKEANFDKLFACLGYTQWPKEYEVTPFMHHINNYGAQFGYKLIKHGDFVPFNFFYTSNISLSRQLLIDHPFDVSFPSAAWEDIELSYRLCELGLKIRYNANAITSHYHPMNIESFSKRQFVVGKSALFFYRKHPYLKNMLAVDGLAKYRPIGKLRSTIINMQIWLSQHFTFYKAKSAYNKLLSDSYMKGLKEAFASETV
jgi:glycosyltransferase involved in cell wall biosynthesis